MADTEIKELAVETAATLGWCQGLLRKSPNMSFLSDFPEEFRTEMNTAYQKEYNEAKELTL